MSNDNEILIAEESNHRIQQIDVQTGTVVKKGLENVVKQRKSFSSRLMFAWMNNTALL